jgi:hypothetical protein
MSVQERAFRVAASKFSDKILFDYIDVEKVKESNWTEEHYVDRFKIGMDAHYFLSHSMQGLLVEMNWKSDRLINVFKRELSDHPGYPSGNQTADSTLHQDKYATIEYLRPYTIPSIRIIFNQATPTVLSQTAVNDLHIFATENDDEGCGYTVKLPQGTNSQLVVNGLSFSAAMQQVLRYQMEYGNNISYAIMQPTLHNMMEYKLVYTQDGFSHFAHNHVRPSRVFSFANDSKLIKFGNMIFNKLKEDPSFICGPVVRIDIMSRKNPQTNDWGGFVVNEIESLEAMTTALGRSGGTETDLQFQLKLEIFWETYIKLTYDYVGIIKNLHNSLINNLSS